MPLPPGIRPLYAGARIHRLARRATLYVESDPASAGYQLVAGVLKSFRLLADGRCLVLDFLYPGELFGFDQGELREHDVEALAPSRVLVYPRHELTATMARDHRIEARLLESARSHVAALQQRAICLGRATARERVACFMIKLRRVRMMPVSTRGVWCCR